MRTRFFILAAITLGAAPSPVRAQAPSLLGYQGRLLRADGTAATGTATVSFAVYDAATGGSALWNEAQTLGLSDGYYATLLGLATPLQDGLLDDGSRWLEVRVGSETLSPRQRVASVAWALSARSVRGGGADVSSLKIGGQTVLDAAGRPAGPARYRAGAGLALDDASQTFSLGACSAGQLLVRDATGWLCAAPNAGTVTSVGAQAPLAVTDGASTPQLSLPQAAQNASGFLSSTDWASFNAKFGALTQCGGDLSGPLSAPAVVRLQSRPLSANAPGTGQILKWSGAQWEPAADDDSGGSVTEITAVAPLAIWNGTSTPQVSILSAGPASDGYLSSADWTLFHSKYDAATQCGGDLDGVLAGPLVAGIRGFPVATSAPASAQVLRFDGTRWTPATLGISDVGGMQGVAVSTAAPASGQVLRFDGARWTPATLGIADVGGMAGTSLSPTAPAPGQVLRFDGSAWTPASLGIGDVGGLSTAYLPLSGGTLTGALAVNATVRAQEICDPSGAHCKTVSSGWANNNTVVVLADAPTVAVDAGLGNVFQVTLGGHRTLGNPTNLSDGQVYTFRIVQDSTGGRKLTWGSGFLFSGNSIPSAAPDQLSIATFTAANGKLYNTGGYNLSGIVPFNFANASGVATGVLITSEAVSLDGLSGAVLASITGPGSPALSVNGGAWTTTATVTAGDALRVRATGASTVLTTTSELVVVGGYTTSWSVTTTTNPTPFGWANVLGAAWSAPVEAGATIPVGYTGALPISISGQGSPQLSVDGGAWGDSGTIAPGQSLNLKLTTDGAPAATSTVTLVMGSFTTTWSATTTPNPAAFQFADVPGGAWSTLVAAPAATPTGNTGPLAVSVTGDGSPEISIAGSATWATSGTLQPGQSLAVRLTSAGTASTARTATVVVGSYSTTWTVTTSPSPAAFTFANAAGVAWNTVTSAAAITPTGHTGAVPVSITGQGSPQISIAGSATWVTSGSLSPGQTLAVRLASAGTSSTARTATVTAGSTSTTWTVTTTSDPTAFTFANVTGAQGSTLATSATATTGGYTAPLSASVSGSGSPQIAIAGTWGTSGTISSGQTLQVRLTSAAAANTAYSATVTVGGYSTTWTVTTGNWIVTSGSTRTWADGTVASSCKAYRNPTAPNLYWNVTGDGLYRIGATPYDAWCDMTTDGGGWTMTMQGGNDTTWAAGNAIWHDTTVNGTPTPTVAGKSKAYQSVTGGEVLFRTHAEAAGYWASFTMPITGTILDLVGTTNVSSTGVGSYRYTLTKKLQGASAHACWNRDWRVTWHDYWSSDQYYDSSIFAPNDAGSTRSCGGSGAYATGIGVRTDTTVCCPGGDDWGGYGGTVEGGGSDGGGNINVTSGYVGLYIR